MRQYFEGGLNALQARPAPATASYYTYGTLPEEIWPVTNPRPVSQEYQDAEADLLGEQDQGFAAGGLTAPLDVVYAQGGGNHGPVRGPGTGRSDEIDARLSDGEYVWDAETVSLLGDGSTEAGAAALDRAREAIRTHKGRALAQGKFSPDAKSPLDYILGAE
jgi:hypothetical protein